MRAEAGICAIHDDSAEPPIWGLAANRRIGTTGLAFWELGIYAGESDERLFIINPGVQLRLLPGSVITPVFGAHVGFLGEPEWFGVAPSATAGLLAAAGRLSLMISGSVATHGGLRGPTSIRIGIGINSREQQAMTIP